MGAGQKKEYNPNVDNSTDKLTQNNQEFENKVKQAFRKASTNGILTKDKFNQTLAVLEVFHFKRLRDTPLAQRLFVLFDKSRSGTVSENQFLQGITDIITDKSNAVMYSFRAYDIDNDNRISKRQFVSFIDQSWKSAFRILGDNIEKNRPELYLSIGDITNWANNKISFLNEQSSKIFNDLDRNKTGFIEYVAFKEWVMNSPISSITAEIEDIEIQVPIHLIKLLKN